MGALRGEDPHVAVAADVGRQLLPATFDDPALTGRQLRFDLHDGARHEDVAIDLLDDTLGHGVQEEALRARHPLVAHDDEVGVGVARGREQFGRRLALSDIDRGLDLLGRVHRLRVLGDELAGGRVPHERDRDRRPQGLREVVPLACGPVGRGRAVGGDHDPPVDRSLVGRPAGRTRSGDHVASDAIGGRPPPRGHAGHARALTTTSPTSRSSAISARTSAGGRAPCSSGTTFFTPAAFAASTARDRRASAPSG